MTTTRADPLSPRNATPLSRLRTLGQSVWLDYLRRDFLLQGGLRALIERDGVTGVNCDTTTFTHAIAWTGQYDAAIAEWIRRGEADPARLYELVAIADVQTAADQLRDVYERTDRRDGYVSFPVSPQLAHDTAAIAAEAGRLWREIDRPNLMIKVLATDAGIAALADLVADGINVNVCLLGGLAVHARVVEAYLAGLERRAGELGGLGCVASLEVGRIDQIVDRTLATHGAGAQRQLFGGQVAITVARLAYQQWKKLHSGRRWTALAARGARPQRLLFASTFVERSGYPETLYVAALIGRETISAMPIATLDSFRNHGAAEATLEPESHDADDVLARAEAAGIDVPALADVLVGEGLARVAADLDVLLASLERKRAEVQTGLPPLNPPRADLPQDH